VEIILVAERVLIYIPQQIQELACVSGKGKQAVEECIDASGGPQFDGECRQLETSCVCAISGFIRFQIPQGITDEMRHAFDALMAAVSSNTQCSQRPVLDQYITGAQSALQAYASQPYYVGTAFISQIDSLLADLPTLRSIYIGCGATLSPTVESVLRGAKFGALSQAQRLRPE